MHLGEIIIIGTYALLHLILRLLDLMVVSCSALRSLLVGHALPTRNLNPWPPKPVHYTETVHYTEAVHCVWESMSTLCVYLCRSSYKAIKTMTIGQGISSSMQEI